jgi:hypothetical protein
VFLLFGVRLKHSIKHLSSPRPSSSSLSKAPAAGIKTECRRANDFPTNLNIGWIMCCGLKTSFASTDVLRAISTIALSPTQKRGLIITCGAKKMSSGCSNVLASPVKKFIQTSNDSVIF